MGCNNSRDNKVVPSTPRNPQISLLSPRNIPGKKIFTDDDKSDSQKLTQLVSPRSQTTREIQTPSILISPKGPRTKDSKLKEFRDEGERYFSSNQYDSALEAFEQATKLCTSDDDKLAILKMMAKTKQAKMDHQGALKDWKKALDLKINKKDAKNKIHLLDKIARTYCDMQDFRNGSFYFEKKFKEATKQEGIKDSAYLQESFLLSECFDKANNKEKAIEYAKLAVKLSDKGDVSSLARLEVLYRLGNLFSEVENVTEAINSYKQYLEILMKNPRMENETKLEHLKQAKLIQVYYDSIEKKDPEIEEYFLKLKLSKGRVRPTNSDLSESPEQQNPEAIVEYRYIASSKEI